MKWLLALSFLLVPITVYTTYRYAFVQGKRSGEVAGLHDGYRLGWLSRDCCGRDINDIHDLGDIRDLPREQ